VPRIKSPFICGGPVPPTHFIGREEAIDTIMGQLTGPAQGGSAVCGERRVGKTSLLHYLMSPQVARDWDVPTDLWHFLLLDCQQIGKPFTTLGFWHQVFKAIADGSLPDELNTQAVTLSKNKTLEETSLTRFFDSVVDRRHFIILLLDEFEFVTEQVDQQNPKVLYQLRQLLNRQKRGLALVTASREPVDVLCHNLDFKGSPFYNNLLSVRLRPFDDYETEALLERAVPPFSEQEVAYIVRIAGRHPLLLQLAADALYRHRSRRGDGRPLNFAAVGRSYERRARPHYRDLWRDMPPQDRMLLGLVALRSFHRREGGRGYAVQGIETLLARFGRALRSLAERGLVTGDSSPAILSSVGEWWLMEEITTDTAIQKEWDKFLSRRELSLLEDAIQAAQVNRQGIRALIEWATGSPET
jgi:hypothetical protein